MKLFNKEKSIERLDILKELQGYPLSDKIKVSLGEFEKLSKENNFLVMFSYGKDSLAIKHLSAEAGIKPKFLYAETGLEIDEIKRDSDVHHVSHGKNIFEIWKNHNCYPIFSKMSSPKYKRKYPGIKISAGLCCYHIKEKPTIKYARKIKTDVIVWGNKASDSNRRKFHFVDYGFSHRPKNQRLPGTMLYPIQHWTDDDIKKYLRQKGVEIKIDRLETGCRYCATDFNKKNNNLQNLLKTDKKDFDKLMRSGFGEQICSIRELDFSKIGQILDECPQILCKYK